jgi:cold shock CspA family protein
MPVIDVQVHPFDRNHPGRPWASPSYGLDSATGEEMVAAMNSVGVDRAIMVSSFSGKDIFVHASALGRAGIVGLAEGRRVAVDVIDGRKGPEAVGLRRI